MAGMLDDVATEPRAETRVDAFTKTLRNRSWGTIPLPIAAGLLLFLGFPPYGVWLVTPLGVALLAVATYQRGFWAGAGLGLLTGLSLFIPLLSWAGGYVGPGWLFSPVGESFYIALLGGLSALVTPLLQRGLGTSRQALWTLIWALVIG